MSRLARLPEIILRTSVWLAIVVVAGWALVSRQEPAPVGSVEGVLNEAHGESTIEAETTPAVPEPSGWFEPTVIEVGVVVEGSLQPAAPVDAPTRITIEVLGIDAPVEPKGVDEHGLMEVPDLPGTVGWYRFGASPGDRGSAVLAAHVASSSWGPGVFRDLDAIPEGAVIRVEYASGALTAWEVVAVEVIPKEALPLDLIFGRDGDPVLTLVTCGGGFSRSERRYDSNVVVVAVPMPGVGRAPAPRIEQSGARVVSDRFE